MKSYVVIGLGRFGSAMCRQLAEQGCEVMAIDIHGDAVQQISPDVTHAVVADARDKEVLKALSVADFDCAVVAIGDNLSASVLATMNLRELGVPKVICKAHDETEKRVLQKLGADRVVIPERDQAIRLAKSLTSPNVLDYIELSNEYGIVELPAPAAWLDKSLKDLNIRAKYGVNIIAIRRNETLDAAPGADFTFRKDDIVVMLGSEDKLSAVQKL